LDKRLRQASFSVAEVAVSIGIIVALMAMLIPVLMGARSHSYQKRCAANQARLGQFFEIIADDEDGEYPFVPVRPGWHYAGVRFSSVSGEAFIDFERPMNSYLPSGGEEMVELFHCPADCGIAHVHRESGTAGRSAFEAYGTSFRANSTLFDARISDIADEPRGLKRSEITTFPSRFVVLGDATWYEVYDKTGRNADWHGEGVGNILFLDGSVRFQSMRPRGVRGPAVAEPVLRPLVEAEARRVERLRPTVDEGGGADEVRERSGSGSGSD
jgi:prepilin-type processing-associated H-X9-DG protein